MDTNEEITIREPNLSYQHNFSTFQKIKLKNMVYQVLRRYIVLFTFFPLLASCATVYTAPDFLVYKVDHRKVALLPFDVTINPGHKSKDVSQEELQELESKQGESFQRALYTQYLQGQQRGRYTVQFQDISETNTLLTRDTNAASTQEALSLLTKSELCNVLDVDAVISGEMLLTKPMGTGAAIASMFLLGLAGSTNEAHVNMSIHERDEGKLLWNYEYSLSGSMLSTPESVAKQLIAGAAGSFPYRK